MSDSSPSPTKKNKNKQSHKKQKKDKKSSRSNKKSKRKSRSCESDPTKCKAKESCEDYSRFIQKSAEMLENHENNSEQNIAFGPVLPPHLMAKQESVKSHNEIPAIGPVIPAELQQSISAEVEDLSIINDDNEGIFGPLPAGESLQNMSVAHVELEQRALEMRLAKFGNDDSKPIDQNVREEWMLELPDVGIKPGLASIKRTFHTGKDRPDFSDRSSWTKTPQSETANPKTSSTNANLKINAQTKFECERDAEQEQIAKKHKKNHKREKSLVEIHQKKLRKEQRKKEKELAAAGTKPERRPFDRDIDLKLNKIDKNQTKSIVDKAKILNTKFACGKTKYL